jgi:hypothetical protein
VSPSARASTASPQGLSSNGSSGSESPLPKNDTVVCSHCGFPCMGREARKRRIDGRCKTNLFLA